MEVQLKKIKKSRGVDGIVEAWLYSDRQIKKKLKNLLKRIWKGEDSFPEEWRKGVIIPIHKKGDTSDVSNYREVTLLCTAYKIYVAILTKRLREEIEEKGSLPETQTGFRLGRGTMDNVRILQQVINKEISKKKGKVYGFFLDLKATFDKMDRKILWKAMEETDIRRGLIEKKSTNRLKMQ